MYKDIKLVAIDLDDTLLHDDSTVSQYTIDVIDALRKKGIEVVIATGRMYQTAKPIGEAIGVGDSPIIIYSGGVVQRVASGEILYQNAIPLDIAKKVLALAQKHKWYVQYYCNDTITVDKKTEVSTYYEDITGATIHPKGEAFYQPSDNADKILAVDYPENIPGIMAILKEECGDTIEVVQSKDTFLEIIAKGVSKGAALSSMAEKRGLTMEQTMAFGNAQNDMAMIEMAGIGVAVANAEDCVKEVADVITASNNEDGVAKLLEEYFLQEA